MVGILFEVRYEIAADCKDRNGEDDLRSALSRRAAVYSASGGGGVTLRRKLVKSQYKLRDNRSADTMRKPLYRRQPGNNGPLGQ